MAVLDCAVDLEALAPVAEKPMRLNFARVCLWCGVRDCESPRCVGLHERSRWAICDECDGYEAGDCTCVHGVIEMAPRAD